MCIGPPKPQPLPATPPTPATMADPAVQQSRMDSQRQLANSGLGATSLTVNLGGQGPGKKKLAGAN